VMAITVLAADGLAAASPWGAGDMVFESGSAFTIAPVRGESGSPIICPALGVDK